MRNTYRAIAAAILLAGAGIWAWSGAAPVVRPAGPGAVAAAARPEPTGEANAAVAKGRPAEKPAPGEGEPATEASAHEDSSVERPPPAGALTAEQERKTLAFLQEHLPRQYAQVRRLQEDDPAAWGRMMRRWWFFLEKIQDDPPRVQQAQIDRYKARTELLHLAHELRQVQAQPQVKALRAKLHTAARRLFDAEQIILRHQLQEYRRLVRQYEKRIEQRSENAEAEVRKIADQYEAFARGRAAEAADDDAADVSESQK